MHLHKNREYNIIFPLIFDFNREIGLIESYVRHQAHVKLHQV